jgi:hypothetical protein
MAAVFSTVVVIIIILVAATRKTSWSWGIFCRKTVAVRIGYGCLQDLYIRNCLRMFSLYKNVRLDLV